MEELLRQWDGECVVVRHDPPTQAWILIAVHSTRLGPAIGGTRMRGYPGVSEALEDAQRLASGMTLKLALTELDAGGGKAVLCVPRRLEGAERAGLLRRYGALVHSLGGLFQTGPDVGTSAEDMDTIAETAGPFVHSRPEGSGGAGDSAPYTALGVEAGMRAVCERLDGDGSLAGRRILIQGIGNVGRHLLERLLQAGAEVLVSDVDARALQQAAAAGAVRVVPPDEALAAECELFAPCALGGVLNEQSIARLRCRAVVGSANNQLARPEDAERLQARGILYAPDFLVSFGGALGVLGCETRGWSPQEARERVAGSIRRRLAEVLALAEAEGLGPEAAARRLAERRLAAGR
jgi:glutamate dehydrogenase/leucine dehydrogenase